MIIGRLIGWLLLLIGLALLAVDVKSAIITGSFAPQVLGQVWFAYSPDTLLLAQPAIQRHIHPFLWDPVIQSVLLCWAFAVFLVAGLLLLLLFRRREHRRRRSFR
jgi:ABC-type Fe3+ transport system permease subunit